MFTSKIPIRRSTVISAPKNLQVAVPQEYEQDRVAARIKGVLQFCKQHSSGVKYARLLQELSTTLQSHGFLATDKRIHDSLVASITSSVRAQDYDAVERVLSANIKANDTRIPQPKMSAPASDTKSSAIGGVAALAAKLQSSGISQHKGSLRRPAAPAASPAPAPQESRCSEGSSKTGVSAVAGSAAIPTVDVSSANTEMTEHRIMRFLEQAPDTRLQQGQAVRSVGCPSVA